MKYFEKDIMVNDGSISNAWVVGPSHFTFFTEDFNPNNFEHQPGLLQILGFKSKETLNSLKQKTGLLTYTIADVSKLQSYPALITEILTNLISSETSPFYGATIESTSEENGMMVMIKDIEVENGNIANCWVISNALIDFFNEFIDPNTNFKQRCLISILGYISKDTLISCKSKTGNPKTYVIDDVSQLQSYPSLVMEVLGGMLMDPHSPVYGAEIKDTYVEPPVEPIEPPIEPEE